MQSFILKIIEDYWKNENTHIHEENVHGLEDIILLRWQYSPDWRINAVCSRSIPANFLVDIDKLILKFIWDFKQFRRYKTTLKKKIRAGGFTFLNFKTYNKVILIKAVQCWHKDRHTDLMNRVESAEINPCA